MFFQSSFKLIKIIASMLLVLSFGLASVTVSAQQSAEPRWVTDEFEITMRNGKGNRQTIVRMLSSGTRIELLETDKAAGYSRVRTSSGAEGWVLNRYLLRQPPARISMPDVQARLARSEEARKALSKELNDLKRERDQFRSQLGSAEKSGSSLQAELDKVRNLSANAIRIDAENKQLKKTLSERDSTLEKFEAENKRLASRANREWFIIGAVVIMVGLLIGLILPRIRWRRKSKWGDL